MLSIQYLDLNPNTSKSNKEKYISRINRDLNTLNFLQNTSRFKYLLTAIYYRDFHPQRSGKPQSDFNGKVLGSLDLFSEKKENAKRAGPQSVTRFNTQGVHMAHPPYIHNKSTRSAADNLASSVINDQGYAVDSPNRFM